jgi:hypothetical protein
MKRATEAKDGEAKAEHIVETTTRQTLKCVLTDGERLEKGQQLADCQNERGIIEEEQDQVKSQFKARLSANEGQASSLGAALRAGYEYRAVDCRVVKNYDTGRVHVIRKDTGETVEARDMSDEERQMGLPLGE